MTARHGRAEQNVPCAVSLAGVEFPGSFQHFLSVPLDLDATPLAGELAFGVDQEGAALDAEMLLAVELFQLDDVEQFADFLVLGTRKR